MVSQSRKQVLYIKMHDAVVNVQKFSKDNGQRRSPYICFCIVHRDLVKKNNPNMTPVEITKELGRLWLDAPMDLKESYCD